VSVMIVGVNDAPVAAADNVTTDENTTLRLFPAGGAARQPTATPECATKHARRCQPRQAPATLGTVARNPDGSNLLRARRQLPITRGRRDGPPTAFGYNHQ